MISERKRWLIFTTLLRLSSCRYKVATPFGTKTLDTLFLVVRTSDLSDPIITVPSTTKTERDGGMKGSTIL